MEAWFKKIFYAVLCVGVLFSLTLLIVLPSQIIVNYDSDGIPRDICSKLSFAATNFFVQGIVFLFTYLVPFFINHTSRTDSRQAISMMPFAFLLPNGLQNEHKMQQIRTSSLSLAWFMGTAMLLLLIVAEWYVAVNNAVLPALFTKDVGEKLLETAAMLFFAAVGIMMSFALWRFMKPLRDNDDSQFRSTRGE